jgi:HAD superfamily hydrolase (TIGR01509 family)
MGTKGRGGSVIIFDCNGVLVDSEQIAAAVAAQEFVRAGVPMTPELVSRYFLGRRPADMFAAIETVTRRKLPENFGATVAAATVRRIRAELRAMPHAAHALTWLREPKCVASSSTLDRIRASLETAGLARFFEPNLFSASDVPNGKPAPDLFLYVAGRMGVVPSECIVVEDSPAGIAAATAAGMTAIGFVGGSHAGAKLGEDLLTAGARTIIADMRQLKGTVVALRGW